MATDRTAIDTIRGYYYQFDLYALQILESSGEKIVLEGIEDVDVKTATETTAIQCKYYEGTSYNHSVIAEPIRWMLKHFSEHKAESFKYQLYGHYRDGQDKLILPLTTGFVKNKFFTFTKDGVEHEYHRELSLTDEEIALFVERLKIIINAVSFDNQYSHLLAKIQETWKCKPIEAESHYYPIILKLVREIATDKDIAKRTVTREAFVENVNSYKKPLFDIWFAKKFGRECYHKRLHKTYFSPGLNMNPYERFFLIDCDDKISDVDIKHMVLSVCKRWSKTSTQKGVPFVPYICLVNLPYERLPHIKTMLYEDGLIVNDGHPFGSSPFYAKAIIQEAKQGRDLTIKMIDDICMIDDVLDSISGKTREIYQFYRNTPYYNNTKHTLISIYIESTDEVEQII